MSRSNDEGTNALNNIRNGLGGRSRSEFAPAPTAATCRANCGCNEIYKARNPFTDRDVCDWTHQLINGEPSRREGRPWNSDVYLDMPNKQITVTTKMLARNITGDYHGGYPSLARRISAEDFDSLPRTVAQGISNWWNGKPYRIRMKVRDCGEDIYKIHFNPRFLMDGETGHHYEIFFFYILKTPETERTIPHPRHNAAIFQSFASSENGYAYFNLADERSVTRGGGITLEPHEFGHLLGLLDAYYVPGKGYTGVQYRINGTQNEIVTRHISNAGEKHQGMMAYMGQANRYHREYGITVAKVITRHMNEVWGLRIEEWELLD